MNQSYFNIEIHLINYLSYITGVILREKIPPFELLLWRSCRGNAYLKTVEITEPLEDPNTVREPTD